MIVESSCGGQVSKECILSIFKLIERSDSTNSKSVIRNPISATCNPNSAIEKWRANAYSWHRCWFDNR
jgi:hypothetical protein